MEQVYLVGNAHLHRREALKVITARGNPEFERRLPPPGRMAATADIRASSPSTTTASSRAPWFTMAYADGRTSRIGACRRRRPVSSSGRWPTPSTTRTASRSSTATSSHANIVVTRDPGGVVERAVVLDFGIAKPAGEPAGLTATNAVIGTLAYRNGPEIAAGHPAGPRSDQYSLACTAYQLVTGTTPFTETSAAALMMAHAATAPRGQCPAPRPRRPRSGVRRGAAGSRPPVPHVPGVRRRLHHAERRCTGRCTTTARDRRRTRHPAPARRPHPERGDRGHRQGRSGTAQIGAQLAQYGPAQYSPTQSGPTRPRPPVAAGPGIPAGRRSCSARRPLVAVLVIAVATTIILVKGSGSNDSGDDLAVAPSTRVSTDRPRS